MATAKMYRVYSVITRPKQDDFWLNIGTAFPHEKGDGFNIVLQALPLHGNSRPKRTAGPKRQQNRAGGRWVRPSAIANISSVAASRVWIGVEK